MLLTDIQQSILLCSFRAPTRIYLCDVRLKLFLIVYSERCIVPAKRHDPVDIAYAPLLLLSPLLILLTVAVAAMNVPVAEKQAMQRSLDELVRVRCWRVGCSSVLLSVRS